MYVYTRLQFFKFLKVINSGGFLSNAKCLEMLLLGKKLHKELVREQGNVASYAGMEFDE
jgi:hypothetical protein